MSILVEFAISTDRFELGQLIAQYEGLEAELERIVPTEDRAIPFVWVTGPPDTLDALTESFHTSEMINAVTVVDDLAINNSDTRQYLYRIDWILDDLDIIKGIITSEGAIMEGEAIDGFWQLRFRFEEHSNVADFYQFLADNDITDFSIDRIHELSQRADRGSDPLTPKQRTALTVAAERGYFDVPRETDLEAVGDELGITQQATSELVRRGVRNTVFETLNLPSQHHES